MSDNTETEASPAPTSLDDQTVPKSPETAQNTDLLGQEIDDSDCITETQRNGSITGIGIVLGFSLIFTGQWSIAPGAWLLSKAIALAVSGTGILFQLSALFLILPLPLVRKDQHSRAIVKFTFGVAIMLVGFVLHVLIDVAIDVLSVDILKWPGQ